MVSIVLKLFIRFILVSFFLCIIFPSLSFAEHEADHRYTIQGYILDDKKQGVANASVKAMLNGKLIAQKTTDSRGFYKAQLHLHDPDFGKELEIITKKGKGTVVIEFTLGDKKTERFHDINFVNGELTEGKLVVSGFPQWVYFAGGGVLLLIGIIVMGRKKKGRKKSA